MSSPVFADKTEAPTEQALRETIGERYRLWLRIREELTDTCADPGFAWHFYGKKTGWLGKNLAGTRNMFFLVPMKDGFRIAFTFGDKAVSEIERSGFPESVFWRVERARKYAEGRTIQIDVTDESDCDVVVRLIRIKHEH
jgi:hypothetical protein